MVERKTPSKRGARGRKPKSPTLPHAPVDPLPPHMRVAAIHGGITDDKGAPTKAEVHAYRDAKRRVKGRKPAVMVAKTEGGGKIGPTDDLHALHLRLLDSFGTRSDFFMTRQIHELENMLSRFGEEKDRTATALNSGLAMVTAVAPTNEIQAALAVQMAGTHTLACEMAGRIMRNSNIDHVSIYANAATKLQRTFLAQLEALDRLRGKGQQVVRVEHVTVEPGGQAIVGDVHHHPQLPSQDHSNVLPLGTTERASLPSPDPIRQTMPGSRHAEREVSNARRDQHRPAPRKSECP